MHDVFKHFAANIQDDEEVLRVINIMFEILHNERAVILKVLEHENCLNEDNQSWDMNKIMDFFSKIEEEIPERHAIRYVDPQDISVDEELPTESISEKNTVH